MSNRSHPMLDLPRTQFEALLEVLTILGIVAVIAMTVWGYFTLPATIPTHYDLSGAPNAYGGKGSLLILPILVVCLTALLLFLSRFPHRYNYPWSITATNAPRQYYLVRLLLRWITLEMVLMMCGLQWLIIQSAQSRVGGPVLLPIVIFLLSLIVTIVLYLLAAAHAR